MRRGRSVEPAVRENGPRGRRLMSNLLTKLIGDVRKKLSAGGSQA
jgi:hypothetical protein